MQPVLVDIKRGNDPKALTWARMNTALIDWDHHRRFLHNLICKGANPAVSLHQTGTRIHAGNRPSMH